MHTEPRSLHVTGAVPLLSDGCDKGAVLYRHRLTRKDARRKTTRDVADDGGPVCRRRQKGGKNRETKKKNASTVTFYAVDNIASFAAAHAKVGEELK